jgi:hypothetical protein
MLRHDYSERSRRSHSRCIRPFPGWSYGRRLREASGSRTFFYVIREFGTNALHGASCPPTDRRVTRHSLWGYVATEGLLVCRMGHRLILLGVDPYSLAMAPSSRRGSASDAHSSHETVCGGAIGVRSFTYLWGVHWGFPKCGITTSQRRLGIPAAGILGSSVERSSFSQRNSVLCLLSGP